jgi:hypothetical protein
MKETLAFLLPPATALIGMRISRLLLGKKLEEEFTFGLRFALGLCVGMLLSTQILLLGSMVGLSLCTPVAWIILAWADIEVFLLAQKIFPGLRRLRFQIGHLWLLALTPVVLLLWGFGRLSTVDGVHEFDAAAFWLLKAKFLYFDHGKHFLNLLHTSNLAYSHMDYPWLVPGLYSLIYGGLGGVDEFVVKVWPFWMMVTLIGAVFSISRFWSRPHPAPILMIFLFCYLPATELFLGQEGATIPLLFGVCTATIFLVVAIARKNPHALAAGLLALACCATTKLEGALYSILWAIPIALYGWRCGWLKNRVIWKTAVFAALLLLPYLYIRLQKPELYPEAHWLHDAATTPARVLHRYPQTLTLAIGRRFFNGSFFNWDSPDKDHLHYIGSWQGRNTFAGPELSMLPWILIFLLIFTCWKKPAHRVALGALLVTVVGQLLALSLIIASINMMQVDLNKIIDFTGEIVGRYFYPFFSALFFGMMTIWLMDHASEQTTVSEPAVTNGD